MLYITMLFSILKYNIITIAAGLRVNFKGIFHTLQTRENNFPMENAREKYFPRIRENIFHTRGKYFSALMENFWKISGKFSAKYFPGKATSLPRYLILQYYTFSFHANYSYIEFKY